jgi:hypothetical protein
VQPETQALKDIVKRWGKDILNETQPDRDALRQSSSPINWSSTR